MLVVVEDKNKYYNNISASGHEWFIASMERHIYSVTVILANGI